MFNLNRTTDILLSVVSLNLKVNLIKIDTYMYFVILVTRNSQEWQNKTGLQN